MHGTRLQQSEFTLQIWPYAAHTVPPVPPWAVPPELVVPPAPAVPPFDVPPAPPVLVVPPELVVPPLPGGGGGTLQVPCVDPIGRTQLEPGQQSPSIVQVPPDFTQTELAQMSSPVAFGTQGKPSQQSAAEEQVWPAVRHAASPLHRGTPRLSSWQSEQGSFTLSPTQTEASKPLQRRTPCESLMQRPELPTAEQQSARAAETLHV